ncbi:MAG: cytochrome b N-terminal domain-containing protein [Planctomycetes bacterium]|nr:cytochrome b N-terminal domain-containing protein [Planctomycetota bacterium]
MKALKKFLSSLKQKLTSSDIWKSIFRHTYEDTPKNRILAIRSNVFYHLHPIKINRNAVRFRYTWGMGGISFLLFLILTLSGILLMFYYRPTIEYAYQDMKSLKYDVPFGPYMRNIHRWAAHAMIITVWLHMLRVFLTGSYKPPRQFNWVIGVQLLVLTMLLSFTGYLLPWDQLSMWAITVGTNMAGAAPFFGHQGPFGPQFGMRPDNDIRFVLLGGSQVGASSILRFYVLHCIAIPIVMIILLCVHFWRVRKDGGISGPKF